MDCEFYLDSDSLRCHIEDIRKERNTARSLTEHLTRAKLFGDPDVNLRIDDCLQISEKLTLFFERLAMVLDETCDDAELTSAKIGQMLKDSRFESESVIHF